MKALFTSALALILILMLSLFTSCAGNEKQAAPQPEASLVKTASHESPSLENMEAPAETLSVKAQKMTSSDGIIVLNSAACTAIEAHLPQGISSEFSKEVGRVYLHTQVEMPKGHSAGIQHVWKRDGKTVSTVDLSVKGPSFRTWSYKTITEKMTGSWSVDVQTASGEVIETVSFEVK